MRDGVAVSVVIPTYGRPALACAAARSALAQALDLPFEVIVVDDGGKDSTAEALAALGDARLRYEWMEHGGPAAARNRGAALAKGNILAFLDSDTLAADAWLKAGVERLNSNPELFAVEGKVERQEQYAATPFTEAVENLNGGRWLTCNVFLRKDAFEALGGFDPRFTEPCREDSEFAFRSLEAGKLWTFEPAALVRHPVREVSARRQFHHAKEGRFEALIERRHPRAYRHHFKWFDGRQMPVYFGAHFLAPAIGYFNPVIALLCLAMGIAVVLYAWCRKRKTRVVDVLRLTPPALLAPYLRLGWVLWGYLRYPFSPDTFR